jgi:hypothetical protein
MLLSLVGLLFLGGGVVLVWWLVRHAGRESVRLFNPRRGAVAGPRTDVEVDYELEDPQAIVPGGLYYLVVRRTGTDTAVLHPILLQRGQRLGRLDASIVTLPGPFRALAGPLELHVEAEYPDRPGRQVKISNAVVLP